MDTTIGFQNAYSIAAPGQAKAYYRDVALTLNDIHGLSESNLEPEQAAVLEAHLRAQGHRMWAATAPAETRRKARAPSSSPGPPWRPSQEMGSCTQRTTGKPWRWP